MQWANEQVIKFNGDNQAHRLDTGIVFFSDSSLLGDMESG